MLPVFRYTTLSRVKGRIESDVLSDASITDSEILVEIETASAAVNRWTRQVFQPQPETIRIDGNGSPLIVHPLVLPFLKLEQISNIDNRTIGEFKGMDRIIPGQRNFPERNRTFRFRIIENQIIIVGGSGNRRVAWEVGSRTIDMISLFGGFTKGRKNVEMVGWWAWLEAHKNINPVTTLSILANSPGIVSISVDDVVDITTGDFILPGDTIALTVQDDTLVPKTVELAIVQSIAGTGPYTLTVDALHSYPVTIPVGAKVYCFGKVPQEISDVVDYMVSRRLGLIAADRTGDVTAIAALEGTLRSERTDNYSYTLGPTAGGNSGSIGKYTGSAQMDLLLRQFAQPAVSVSLI